MTCKEIITGLRKTNEELADKLADLKWQLEQKDRDVEDYEIKIDHDRIYIEELEDRICELEKEARPLGEQIKEKNKRIEELEGRCKAKDARINELCARIDKLIEQHYIDTDIAVTKEIAERFASMPSKCALSPNDITMGIAKAMRNKYEALVAVGFSHDDAMSLIPMWLD